MIRSRIIELRNEKVTKYVTTPRTAAQVAKKFGISRPRAWELLTSTPGITEAGTVVTAKSGRGRPSKQYVVQQTK